MLKEAYCINLEHRTDRWTLFQKERAKLPSDFKIRRYKAIEIPSDPRKGCAKSHINIIKLAKDRCKEHVLVFEDDVQFTKLIYNKMVEAIEELPKNWDIFWIGHYYAPDDIFSSKKVVKSYFAQGTHCILYRKSSFEHLIGYTGIPSGIDDYISYLASTRKINLYLSSPSLAWQAKGHSDIKKIYLDPSNQNNQLAQDYRIFKELFRHIYNNQPLPQNFSTKYIVDEYLKQQCLKLISNYNVANIPSSEKKHMPN